MAGFRRLARTLRGACGHLGVAPVGRVELAPQAAQLLHVVRAFQRLGHQ
jgi:hypothetical protein